MKPEILLAIDGSEMSNRAIDHVGNVVGKCKDFRITLLHVLAVPPVLREHQGSEDPDDTAAIRTRVTADAHSDVAAAIVDEAKRGEYGIVVLGRRGKSTLKEFLMGTVVHKVVHQVDGCAVWVVG